jgi:hypothetical protein
MSRARHQASSYAPNFQWFFFFSNTTFEVQKKRLLLLESFEAKKKIVGIFFAIWKLTSSDMQI